MSIIDAHIHFWDPTVFHYRWLREDHPLYRSIMPEDIAKDIETSGITGAIIIEAANTPDEIPWLLQLAEQYGFISGVMGWLNWDQPDIESVIQKYIDNPHFRGARFNWIENSWKDIDYVKSNLAIFDQYHLSCEVLTRIHMLPDALAMIRSHTTTNFIINHFGGAKLSPGGEKSWAEQMRPLAGYPNIYMKFSGFITACEPCPVATDTLRAYWNAALNIFGEHRLIFASNYPINESVTPDYNAPITALQPILEDMSPEQRNNLMYTNAQQAYRLKNSGV